MGASGLLREGWVLSLKLAGMYLAQTGLSKSGGHPIPLPRLVAVAYADWVPAEAPRPASVVEHAGASDTTVVLLDTFQKNGSTLLDWLPVEEITTLVQSCRKARVKIALAGSLTAAEIERLRSVRPDWFAVRGAVCDGGREGHISEQRVRRLADLVHSF